MKWAQIKEIFREEWVLIQVHQVDGDYRVVEGEVLAHSKDKEDIYRAVLEIRPKEFSIEYTGQFPDELAVVLPWAVPRR